MQILPKHKPFLLLLKKNMGSKHTTKGKSYYFCSRKQRKDARVIEWTGLEIRRTALLYRGFESHSFRRYRLRESLRFPFFVPVCQQVTDAII